MKQIPNRRPDFIFKPLSGDWSSFWFEECVVETTVDTGPFSASRQVCELLIIDDSLIAKSYYNHHLLRKFPKEMTDVYNAWLKLKAEKILLGE